ncbi:MAG: beta-N-acetylhexosaminidase [Clostridia bacterium]|nr:beta-N-acetylhexosaminidase [Clostridia bacterium]
MKHFFGAMLDMSRNAVMKPSEVINYAKILKSFGYNMIQLYTEDTYEVKGEPYFGYLRGKYTTQELSFIVSECEKIGVEVIPCIQTLAHLNQLLRWKDVYGKATDVGDILLVGEPRTYELIENMFKSLRESFTSSYVHIGMDEAEMIGRGEYFNRNGYQDHLTILKTHLRKVIDIAQKYGFKPIMWSDMFFKLATGGAYYDVNANVTQEVKNAAPQEVGLVYWDYYHDDKEFYDGMFAAHKKFDNEIWFAGGAWTWTGFAPGNDYAMKTLFPALRSAKEQGVKNIMITLWGDNGKECSFYAVLPALYAAKRCYDGETDVEKIKAEFRAITGEDFDALRALDIPNYVGGNTSCLGNVSKHALYSDPFNGFLDCVCTKEGVEEEYRQHAKTLAAFGEQSAYAYLFESAAALCSLMSLKYGLGVRTRKAYQAEDKAGLRKIVTEYEQTLFKLEIFYQKYSALWYKENKASGFDIQDLRLGGLKQRLCSCKLRLEEYLTGKLARIEELEEEILPYYQETDTPCYIGWDVNVSANRI